MDNFLIIAITRPDFFFGEGERINQILEENRANYVHIRKPYAEQKSIKNLIQDINPVFHYRLKLHDHFELLDSFNLGGIHLNSRNADYHNKAKSISISCHSLDEIEKVDKFDYFFISPIFDSISKEGYHAAFDLNEVSHKIKGKRSIALGGVTPDKFPLLSSLGFTGAALLSYFFPKNNQ